MENYDAAFGTSDFDDRCTCEDHQERRPRVVPQPRFRAVTPIREAVERLNRVLEHHDDDSGPIDLSAIELYCELARARELLDAAQIDLGMTPLLGPLVTRVAGFVLLCAGIAGRSLQVADSPGLSACGFHCIAASNHR